MIRHAHQVIEINTHTLHVICIFFDTFKSSIKSYGIQGQLLSNVDQHTQNRKCEHTNNIHISKVNQVIGGKSKKKIIQQNSMETHRNFPECWRHTRTLAQKQFVNHEVNYQCEQPK